MKQDKQPRGFFEDIGASIFEPGANSAVIVAINCTFCGLIISLGVLMLLWGVNIHLVFLAVLAGGLQLAINWLVYMSRDRRCVCVARVIKVPFVCNT